jgi:folate-binding protein YgfZ
MGPSPFDAPLLFDLTGRADIAVTGKDRVPFLQGLVTNDVKRLSSGEGCAAAFLTPKGKLLAELVVLAAPEELLVDGPPALAATLEQLLRKYVVFGEIGIEDRTAATGVLHLEGAGAGALLRTVIRQEPPAEPHASVVAEGARVVRETRGGFEGFDLRTPRERLGALRSALVAAGAVPSPPEVLESARIEAGIPRWGAELTGDVLPDEAGLPARGWVSYSKGCYVGQETVARIRTYGHVNRSLVGLLVEGANAPVPGAEIHSASSRVGAVTSATHAARLGKAVALGYVKRESAAPGTSLTVDASGGPRPAVVTVLPVDR